MSTKRGPGKRNEIRTDLPPARDQGLLGRWSRRKAMARAEDRREGDAAATDVPSPIPDSAVASDAAHTPELTDADMPPIESLDEQSDYAPFFSSGVSESLRRAALRKLFHSPRYNVMDRLDVYIDDVRDFVPLGDTVTADMKQQMERLALQTAGAQRSDTGASDALAVQGAEPVKQDAKRSRVTGPVQPGPQTGRSRARARTTKRRSR